MAYSVQTQEQDSDFDFHITSHGGGDIDLPEGFVVAVGGYSPAGPDLILNGTDGQSVLIEDFYTNPPAGLNIGHGHIPFELAQTLAGPQNPGAYAQTAPQAAEAIGQIETAEGTVTAVHADGTSVTLQSGDPIFQGDIIRTGASSSVGVTFNDETTFSLDEKGEITLDEMVYDPDTGDGSFSSTLTSGVFSFVSGQIAKANPESMEITTPVATIGIRGTQGVIKQENGGQMQAALLEEAGGVTGELILTNGGGTVTLNQPNQFSAIVSFSSSPGQPAVVDMVQIVGSFGTKTIRVVNSVRAAATQRKAEAKQEKAEEAAAQAEEAKAEAEALAEQAAQAEGAEAEALAAQAAEAAAAAAAAEAAAAAAAAEAEAAAAEAALLAGAQTEFDAQLSQLEEQLGLLTGPQNQQQGNPFDNVAVTTDNGEDPIRTETQTTIVQINQQIEQTINKIVNIIDKKVEETKKTVEDDVAAAISNIDEWHAGTSGGDTLTGSGQRDGIAGLAGEDIIDGGGGNDVIAGGSGNDNIHGGAGDDFIHGDIPTGTDYEELLSHFSTEIAEDSANPQSTYDDTIYGDAGNDVIDGGLGDDHIYGGADNDTIDGGDGADTIEGGYGDDTIIGDAGNDSLTGNDGDDTIIGGDGEDIIYGNDGQDTIYGSDGADVIEGGNGADTINGGADADTMHGDADNDTIVGDAGDDTLYGDDGDDKLYGSDGADTIYGDGTLGGTETGNDIIHGGDGADTLYGGNGNNILYGDAGNDTLVGGGGLDPSTSNNTLFGGAGEDTLLGATGTKFIDGGDDNDTIEVKSLDNSNGTFSGGSGEDTIDFTDLNSTSITTTFGAEGTGSFSYVSDNPTQPGADSFTGIEKILLSNRDDTVSIDDLSFISTIDAGAGTDDTLALRGTNYNFIGTSQFTNFETLDLSTAATTVTIDANFKSDTGISTINGSGDDTIDLGSAWKYYSNSSGYNVYKSIDETQEILIQDNINVSNVAYNTVTGTPSYDGSINDTAGNDLIWAMADNDTIFGSGGNDIIAGGSGIDTIEGGTGDDTIYGDVPTNSGTATLLYDAFGAASFTADTGPAGPDIISDGSGNDTVWAGDGNDVIKASQDTDADVYHGEGGTFDKLSYEGWSVGLTMAVTSSGTGSVTNGSVSDTFDGIEYLMGSNYNDQVSIGDLSFISTVNGAGGIDTLALTGTNYNFIGTSQITNFETLDLSTAATTVTIDANFKSDTGISTINGSGDDTINLSNDWKYSSNSSGFNVYKSTDDTQEIYIQEDITVNDVAYNQPTGTSGMDGSINGTANDDLIWTLGGNDSIFGNDGNDIIAGGSGSDNINGGTGDDTIYGDVPTNSGIAALLYQFFGVVSFLSDIGVAEGDTISDGNGSDTVWAGGGNDVITATEDTDADVFHGEGGALDKLSYSTWTTAGVTMAVTSSGAGSVTNGSVSDTFDGIEYLVGSGQDDQVSIGDLSFISTIDGDAGTDTLALTGTSYNLINTSQITNFETLDLSAAATTLTIDENFVSDTGINTINGSADDSVDLSHGWIYHGSSGGYKTFKTIGEDHTLNISDTITTSNSYYNAVQGTTSPETLTGTTGRDVIWGNDNADSIDGGSGDDVIAGGAGSDIINGGNDDDVIYGDSPASSYDDSSKYLHYNFGDITSGVAADGNDTIDGGAGSDTIYGGGGDDTIYATLDGVSDSFYGDNSTYDASSGTDTLSYVNQTGSTPLSSVIFTGSGTGAVVDGGSSDSFSQIENFVGSTYDDSLDLSGGVMSTIDGGSGADTFNLNNGAVTSIAGGEGDDTFNLNSNALSIDQISGDAGDDTFNITDLNILGSTILDGGSESSGDTVAFVNATASGPLALGNNMLNFETYDITGASGVHNNLTIDQLGVAENGASTVTIIGDAGDAVLFAANDSWVAGANDGTYTSYTSTYSAGTTIKVDNDITVGTF